MEVRTYQFVQAIIYSTSNDFYFWINIVKCFYSYLYGNNIGETVNDGKYKNGKFRLDS